MYVGSVYLFSSLMPSTIPALSLIIIDYCFCASFQWAHVQHMMFATGADLSVGVGMMDSYIMWVLERQWPKQWQWLWQREMQSKATLSIMKCPLIKFQLAETAVKWPAGKAKSIR